MAGGKPDFSGIWLTGNPLCAQGINPVTYTCGLELPMGREGINMGASLPAVAVPAMAGGAREGTNRQPRKDDPHVRCLPDTFLRAYSLPHLLKFVQTPRLLVVLDEMNANYRQVFMDARPLPDDPVPSWQGYSSRNGGRYARRRLDRFSRRPVDRLEWKRPHVGRQSARANPPARFRTPRDRSRGRRSQGVHEAMDVTLKQQIAVDTELVDEICLENENRLSA